MFNIPANQLDSFNYLMCEVREIFGGAFLKLFVSRYVQRKYHNLNHLAMLHKHIVHHSNESILATMIHDYEHPFTPDAEWLSLSALAHIDLSRTTADINRVIMLVRSTCEGAPSSSCDFFRDADRAILGQSPTIYAKYTQEIKEEADDYFAFSNDKPDFHKLRKAWLEKTLKQDIFRTEHMRFVYEKQAIENLTNELKSYEN